METPNNINTQHSENNEADKRKVYIRSQIIFTTIFAVICAAVAGIFALMFIVLAPKMDEGWNGTFLAVLGIIAFILVLVLIAMIKTTFQDDPPRSSEKLKYVFVSSQIALIVLMVAAAVFSVVFIFNTIGTTYVAGDFSDVSPCDGCFIFTNNRADGGKEIVRFGIDKDDVKVSYYCKECFEKVQKMDTSDKNGVDENDVWSTAKDIVRSQLKAPSTATFCSKSSATITHSGNKWTIKGYVDAENSFGAMLRNDFTVVITISGDEYTVNSCTITAR